MTSLALIVPTKGRPLNAARLIDAITDTAGWYLQDVVLAIDPGEPLKREYEDIVAGETSMWAHVHSIATIPQRMGPVLNAAAAVYADTVDYIGFMGDDHVPRTDGWDEKLVEALDERPGIAYGNDLHQGESLPTALVMSSDIVRILGYMCPPGQEHLYLDDFWKTLGTAVGNLKYCPDVVIEHMHPHVGKAPWDESYALTNDASQYQRDHAAYGRFLTGQWPADVIRLLKELHLG